MHNCSYLHNPNKYSVMLNKNTINLLAKIVRLFYVLVEYHLYTCKIKFVLKHSSNKCSKICRIQMHYLLLTTILIFSLLGFSYLVIHKDCNYVYYLYCLTGITAHSKCSVHICRLSLSTWTWGIHLMTLSLRLFISKWF